MKRQFAKMISLDKAEKSLNGYIQEGYTVVQVINTELGILAMLENTKTFSDETESDGIVRGPESYGSKFHFKGNQMRNVKGFSLLEVMAALVIMTIIMFAGLSVINSLNVAIAKASKKAREIHVIQQANPAVAPGADERNFVGVLNQCVEMKGTNGVWFAKRVDDRVVSFFQNSANCTTGGIGTLSALNNPTYDDVITDTFWNVSGDQSTLRVLVRKLNLKK